MFKPNAVRYALYTAAASALFILIEHWLGYNTIHHEIGQYTRMVPMLFSYIMLFVCIRAQRNLQSSYSWSDAFKTGAGMYLLYSLLFTLIIIVYQQFINPDFYSTFRAFTIQQLEARNASTEQRAKALQEVDLSYSGSAMSYLLLFVFSSIFGLGLSAIFSLFLRKKAAVNP